MQDLYTETRRDLDRLRKMLRRLRLTKEKEIAVCRVGKRLGASEIKAMREMEATIESLFERQRLIPNSQQRSLIENFKNQYQANMRGWRNRLAFAERQRIKRRRREGKKASNQ